MAIRIPIRKIGHFYLNLTWTIVTNWENMQKKFGINKTRNRWRLVFVKRWTDVEEEGLRKDKKMNTTLMRKGRAERERVDPGKMCGLCRPISRNWLICFWASRWVVLIELFILVTLKQKSIRCLKLSRSSHFPHSVLTVLKAV